MEKLLEKLKEHEKEHRYNDFSAVLQCWYDEHKIFKSEDTYNRIYGAVWGLYAAGVITTDEHTSIVDELINMV